MKYFILLKSLFSYPNLPVRILASLFAAVVIVYFGAEISFFDALLIPSFYYSVGGSFVIAFLLISWVHYSLVTLDGKFLAIPPFLRRGLLHIIPGFLLPCLAAYLLAALYFYMFGLDIRNTDYRRFNYPIILGMLFFLNWYYFVCFFVAYLLDNKKPDNRISVNRGAGEKKMIEVQHHGEVFELDAERDVACFFHTASFYNVLTFSGDVYNIHQYKSLTKIEAAYSKEQFFKVSKNLIVNFAAFDKHTQKRGSRAWIIHLQPGMTEGKEGFIEKMFILDKNKIPAFKKWTDR